MTLVPIMECLKEIKGTLTIFFFLRIYKEDNLDIISLSKEVVSPNCSILQEIEARV
jgi:hypothetical protein